jgi:hypothetical protein
VPAAESGKVLELLAISGSRGAVRAGGKGRKGKYCRLVSAK